MIIKKSFGRLVFEAINTCFMIAMIIITLYPLLYVVFASLSNANEFLSHTGILLRPIGFDTISYRRAFEHPLILSSYWNTIVLVTVGTTINVILTAVGAYFMSRNNVLYKRQISMAIIFTMFFSGGLIPLYLTVKDLGLYNSFWALILPTAVNTFNLIVMKTGFEAIPESLEESARIDGAGHFTILFKLVMPLSLPTVAVIILYYGVAHWNAWFNASIFLNTAEKYPLQLVLRQILISNSTDAMTIGIDIGEQLAISETIKYATIVIATLPILLIYPFLQKYFVKGIMIGAVKG